MWTFSGKRLSLENGKIVDFPFPIMECELTSSVLIVVLDLPPRKDVSMTENVFGVSLDGHVLWQIERHPNMSSDPQNYFTGVLRSLPGQSPEIVRLANWNGVAVDVDIHSGKILQFQVTK